MTLLTEQTPAKKHLTRQATINDWAALCELEERGFSKDRFSAEQWRYLLTRAHATTFVIEAEQRLCGAAILLWRKGCAIARLYSIVVDPECRGQGFGKRLFETCQSVAAQHGCKRIHLEVRADNHSAIQFYEDRGFQVVESLRGYYEDGMNGLRLVKYLAERFQPHILPIYKTKRELWVTPALKN
ncbi:GNAT family N-acetyltransferase [Candidatus Acetothermia bacterium]|nr:GNAT family N-acetyltransferase [Candidatus Acetothermia bacterium]MBI3644206.1 GNAT family N-acetyltransferase [Candidatus Acetothermia bacterium]